MTEVARSVASPVRHRNVTWQDPLAGAALARDLSGLVFEPRPAQAQVPADRPAENGHGR